jgi:hypothetical protein
MPEHYKLNPRRMRRTSSSISKSKTRNRNTPSTIAKKRAGTEKRELLEHVIAFDQYLGIAGIDSCYPYFDNYPMSEMAIMRGLDRGFNVTRYCQNTHACPVCTSRYMAIKREEYIALADNHESNGGFLVTQVLTIRSTFDQNSKDKYKDLNNVWSRMINKSAFKSARLKVSQPEYLRVQEEELNETGWFPHLHIVWFFDKSVSRKAAKEYTSAVSRLWSETANKWTDSGADPQGQGSKKITKGSSKTFGQYLFKHGFHDLKLNVGDLVTNETEYSIKPFELFRLFLDTGLLGFGEAWLDFQKASYGTTRAKFSRGLRLRLNVIDTKIPSELEE